jgi:damage-control phosphatase, subfamily I
VKPHVECGACLVHWVYERAAPHTANKDMTHLTRSIVDVLLRDVSPSANLGSLCNSTVYAASELTPAMARHYEELKATTNEHAKRFLPEAVTHILDQATAREGLERACLLAAAANVSSLGAPSGAYTFSELRGVMGERTASTLMVGDVLDAVNRARHILYVTDNAGEIAFDAPVMALLKAMGKRVTLLVKTDTFFEDATPSDAYFFGLDRLVDEIVTTRGFAVPAELEPPAAQALANADLVMAKGTGSYEALHGEALGKPAVFMLKIKCPVLARETGVDMGTTVVKVEQASSRKRQQKVKIEVERKKKPIK